MRLTVTHEGRTTQNATPEQALAMGYPQAAIDAAVTQANYRVAKAAARRRIHDTAGDTGSLLGTTSDVSACALMGVMALVAELPDATDFAGWKTAALARLTALGGQSDFVAMADAMLTSIASGSVRVPAIEKGLDVVSAEVAQRATAVSDALMPI